MTVKDIAKKYRTTVAVVYSVVTALETRDNVVFVRRGGKLQLTDKKIKLIEDELERRGHASDGADGRQKDSHG